MDTRGFFKNYNNDLLYAPNYVINKNYELYSVNSDSYDLPIDGWYWFKNEDDAYLFFDLLKPENL